MSPLSTALRQIFRFLGVFSGNSSHTRTTTANESPNALPASPTSSQEISHEQYDTGHVSAAHQASPFPSGLPYISTYPDLNLYVMEAEETQPILSYEEILGIGKRKVAAYEELCRQTNVSTIKFECRFDQDSNSGRMVRTLKLSARNKPNEPITVFVTWTTFSHYRFQ